MELATDKDGRKLYVCPLCGYVDHDDQDGTGHWEQGTSENWEKEWDNGKKDPRTITWSSWLLMCNGCGELSEMQQATADDLKRFITTRTE